MTQTRVETQEVPIDVLRDAVTRALEELEGSRPGVYVSLGQVCERAEAILGAEVTDVEVADEVTRLTGRDEDAEYERVRDGGFGL